ncbi:TonB-dependent receptor [Colwelliaceae bacterium 6471]
MNKSPKKFTATLLASSIAMACSGIVYAAENDVDSNVEEKKEMEVISVTATRRSQSITSVPYNISAIGGDALKQAGISSLGDLTKRLPGISYTDRGARSGAFSTSIAMRGLSTEDGRISSPLYTAPGVSTYVGETPLFANIRFYDLDRVEVLRGPQGTLYGSGSLGGTLRFIPNMPRLDGTEFELSTDLSQTKNGDGFNSEVNAVVNLALTDTLAVRANIGRSDSAGWIDQPYQYQFDTNGIPQAADTNEYLDGAAAFASKSGINDEDSSYGRIAALWQPNDDVKATLAYNYQKDNSGGNPARAVDYQDLGDYDTASLADEPYSGETDLMSLDVEVNLGFATLTTSVSTYTSEQAFKTDVTGSYEAFGFYSYSYGVMPRPFVYNTSATNDEANIVEMRLVSNNDSTFNWVVGAFYMDQDTKVSSADFYPGYTDWSGACFEAGREDCGLGIFGVSDPMGLQPQHDQNFLSQSTANFQDNAIFGELSWQITDQWQMTGGFRSFDQTFENEQANGAFFVDTVSRVSRSIDANDTLFKFNTSYQLSNEAMLYFTRSEGFRRGGANALPVSVLDFSNPDFPDGEEVFTNTNLYTYAPDEVINMELGIKGQLDQLRYSVALFDIEWNDIQLDTLVTPYALAAVVNAGTAESQGLEVELNTMFDNGLDVTVGYSYVDAILTNPSVEKLTEAGIDPLEVKDQRLPGVSKHTASLDVNYTQEVGDWYVIYGVNGSYRTDARSQLNPALSTITDGYSMWNSYVAAEIDNWAFRLYVNNMFNAEGIVNTPPLNPGEGAANIRRNELISRPLTVGINVKYSFF